MTSAFSWQNSISLCPASFHIPRPNYPVTPGVSWLPTFAFQSPIMKRTSFLGVTSKKSCRSSQSCEFQKILYVFGELFNFSLFSITGWSIDLDYCDIEWFALEMNRDYSLSLLRLYLNTAFQTPLLTMRATPFLLRDSCPQQQI